MKTAIILGATGLTGGILLQKLIEDPRYSRIKLFSRSSVAVKDPKIEEHLVDLFKLEEQKHLFTADEVFCCIGTTKSKTSDEETYRKIDYGIPVTAAKIAAENTVPVFAVISALGADAESRIFYNRTKGEMERDILKQGIEKTYIFRPSLIGGDRVETRTGENIAKKIMKVINPLMIGPLEKYRSIDPEVIAAALINVANDGYSSTIIPSDEIKQIAARENKI
ncbi:MAG TPA: hypothetical protein VK941_01075 [Gillisia sp.]|nr:hypothetical protein [Gillisia sp.]